eukprot:TRINITY_DN17492_c0_g1_i4.p1 TRINITY_DN17492_c0_g1~~TRINITY_DN17492_c0_g1_i4.p1  ORF type:complete len:394 (-),score=93.17 TRINITY_DN17492_c0_g1_i4:338-1519(-)
MVETADEQQFCLKWNNYSHNMTSVFKDMLEQEHLCDVTLRTQDETIKAHRLILTACSGFFRKAFQDVMPWQQPVVFLKDMKYEDLRGIIEFIYNGEVSIDQGSLQTFLAAAESLKIKGLTDENQRPINNGTEQHEDFNKIKNNKDISDRINALKTPTSPLEENGTGGLGGGGTLPLPLLLGGGAATVLGAMAGAVVSSLQQSGESQEVLKPDLQLANSLLNNNTTSPNNTTMEESSLEEEMDEAEWKEYAKSEGIMSQEVLEKMYETDEHFLNNGNVGANGLQLEQNQVTPPPGMSPAEMGLKKTCPHCFQKLSWHALSRHIRDMHKAKADLVNCKYCFKTFRNKNSLGCHIWRFHKRGRDTTPTTNGTAANRVTESPGAAAAVLPAATASIS